MLPDAHRPPLDVDPALPADVPPGGHLTSEQLQAWLRHLTESQAAMVVEMHRTSREQPDAIRRAVEQGVTAALTHRDTVATTLGIVVEVAQERTAQHAGRWIVGWSGRMIRNAVLLLVFGWLAIKLLGWDVAAAVGKWLASSK